MRWLSFGVMYIYLLIILFRFSVGLMILIGLAVYTSKFIELEVSFSWSYGAGWSVVGMYIISIILLFADK